jgi:hypothetical protein
MPTHPAPELLNLRRLLRQSVLLSLELRRHRAAGTLTSAIELRNERDSLAMAGRIEHARQACKAAGVKLPRENEQMAVRYTRRHGWRSPDGRKVTRSERSPHVGYVDAPEGAVWSEAERAWV